MQLYRFGPRSNVNVAADGEALSVCLSSGRAKVVLRIHEAPATQLAGLLKESTVIIGEPVTPRRLVVSDKLRRALARVHDQMPNEADTLTAALEQAGFVHE